MTIVRKLHNYVIPGILFSLISCILLIYSRNRLPVPQNALNLMHAALVVLSTIIGGLVPGLLTTVILSASVLWELSGETTVIGVIFTFIFLMTGIAISFFISKYAEQEELASGIIESIADPLILFDRSWKCTYVNEQAQQLFNKKKEDMINKNIRKVLPDVSKDPMYTKILHAVQDNRHIHFIHYAKNKDLWMDANLYPSNRGLAILFMDISHQKSLEKQLKESEVGFKKLIDSNIIGVAIEDFKGNVQYANDVYLEMVGYDRRDLEQNKVTWEKVTPEEYMKKDESMRKLLLQKGSIKPYEKEYIKKNGDRISVLKGSVLLDKKKKSVAVFALDFSKRKEKEKRKDEFISIASHELKTPITSIKGFTQLLMRSATVKGDEKTASYLNRMLNQINRLTYLVNDILDVRRIEDNRLILNKDFIDLNQLVEDAVKEIHISSPPHVITWEPAKNAMLYADYNRIYQVCLNILTNAVKYSPATEEIKVTLKEEQSHIIISFADRGIGIEKEKQKHIFNKFYQIDGKAARSSQGLGIGLYIATEIIKKHGGKIWVDSPTITHPDKDGKELRYGSTFYISLPKGESN